MDVSTQVAVSTVARQQKPLKKKGVERVPAEPNNDAEESPPDKPPAPPSRFLLAALRLWEIKNRMKE
jgi:hypothetical protein